MYTGLNRLSWKGSIMKITRTLLIKFSRDECTPEEIESVNNWLEDGSFPGQEPGEEIPGGIKESVWRKMQIKINQRPFRLGKVIMRNSFFIRVAAVLLVVAGVSAWLYLTNTSETAKIVYFKTGAESRKILLSDSSIIFLSPHSKVKLKQPFGNKKREIALTGQAVFEVVKDAFRPFTVITGNINTTALGTSFKVSSFPDKGEINVSLSYGKVIVKDQTASGTGKGTLLDPGEKVVYNKATRNIRVTKDAYGVADYKSDILYFNNAGLKEVVEKIEQYYHLPVQYSALKQSNWRVSGEFNYQPLETVMETISYSCNISYKIENNRLILIPVRN